MGWPVPDYSQVRASRRPRGLAALPPKRRAEIQAMGRAKVRERMQKHDKRAGPVIQQFRGRGCSLGETALLLVGKLASPGRDFGFRGGRGAYWSPMAVKRIEDRRLGRAPEVAGA